MMKLSIGANVNIQWMEDLLIYNYIEIIGIKDFNMYQGIV